MDDVIKRTKIIIAVLIVAGVLFGSFAVYLPMKQELETALYNNFTEISNSRFSELNTGVQKSVEGARSLSSRTMIRDVIVDYQNGSISIDELKNYTLPKYLDGVKALDNVTSASRYVGGDVIVQYNKSPFSLDQELPHQNSYRLSYNFILTGGRTLLHVNSPVMLKDKTLGFDSVVFDLTEHIKGLSNSKYKTYIAESAACDILRTGSRPIFKMTQNNYLYKKDNTIYYIRALTEKCCLVNETKQEDLLEPANHSTQMILILGAVFLLCIFFLWYFYIIRFASRKLSATEKSRDHYKEMLEKDDLTGTYSKLFLEYWKAEQGNDATYSVVMTDIDDFKKINDYYGHLVGDQALKKVAEIMMLTVRDDDLIARFGGDEFLLLLKNVGKEEAEDVMDRIRHKLDLIREFEFKLDVSYGVCELGKRSEFNHALTAADERMYLSKQSKKNEKNP